jgi:hypothetical protein
MFEFFYFYYNSTIKIKDFGFKKYSLINNKAYIKETRKTRKTRKQEKE